MIIATFIHSNFNDSIAMCKIVGRLLHEISLKTYDEIICSVMALHVFYASLSTVLWTNKPTCIVHDGVYTDTV